MMGLLEKWLAGGRVTLIDKIGTVACLAELEGMYAELSARRVLLTEAERGALATRRAELLKPKKGGHHAG